MPFAILEHQTADMGATVRPARVSVKNSSHQAVLDDANSILEFDSASGTTLTIPPDSTTEFDVGVVIGVYQQNTGSVSIVPGSGVTLRSADGQTTSRVLTGQYAEASIRKRAANDWVLVGDLT